MGLVESWFGCHIRLSSLETAEGSVLEVAERAEGFGMIGPGLAAVAVQAAGLVGEMGCKHLKAMTVVNLSAVAAAEETCFARLVDQKDCYLQWPLVFSQRRCR